ncbi:MAG: penicillin-binding protein activator [Deltaproteobacteria bacterium]|nr:penicillin-binding protein activator [Deltaproteobacteria bacterium]
MKSTGFKNKAIGLRLKAEERTLMPSAYSLQPFVCAILYYSIFCIISSIFYILSLQTAFSEEASLPPPADAPSSVHLGVILPLSGKYAQFGEQALKGILLAADIFESSSSENKDVNLEIIVKDTKDDPLATEKAVEELSADEGVAAIIGPLLSITAMGAAQKAQKLKIPMIALSQKPGLTNAGDYIFRNFLSPLEQARTVANYAIDKLKCKKFAVLYPNSPYGIELANLFKDEVKKSKGEIVADEQYKEGQTYFGKEIVKLFKIKETEKKEGRRKMQTFEAAVAVDALYIPGYFDTIGLIAPHLAYYNVKDIKLLGSNGWNSPKLIELANKYVEGAVFADGFSPASKREATLHFVNNFKNLYGAEPEILSAQAYDAVKMVIEAMIIEREKKQGIRNSLANLRDFHGATGDITFGKDREAVKNLFMLEVKNGKIVEIN